jgi:hypothetical protein
MTIGTVRIDFWDECDDQSAEQLSGAGGAGFDVEVDAA